jgi:ferredoxin-NADP reductase
MTDVIQLISIAILAICLGYCLLIFSQNFSANRLAVAREAAELGHLNALTGELTERQRVKKEIEDGAWNGFRKFRVSKKQIEAKDQCSFYLTPHDGRPVPPFQPGQFLTFRLDIPDQRKPVIRCYSLSDCPRPDHYRVTIKRVPPPRDTEHPPGLSSNFFHDEIEEGQILDVRAPGGHFFLDTTRSTPVVLIGGGIGLTPVLSMVNHIVETGSKRETWFFYGVQNGEDHAMKEHLQKIDDEHDNIKICVVYSRPREGEDVEGEDYKYKGRVGADLFREVLPSNNYDYYFCGPPPMMNSLFEGLRDWDVPEEKIHYEAFGPATVSKKKDADKASEKAPSSVSDAAENFVVNFAKTGKEIAWDPDVGSILDLAEDNDIVIDSGCRAGNCGTCETAIKSGDVEYLSEPGEMPDAGSCLACVAVPKGPITLDA